jgi:hypothetical protein
MLSLSKVLNEFSMKALASQNRKSRPRIARNPSAGAAPGGRPLGRVSKLSYLMRDQPDLYATMLNYVRAGAYLHVAAAAIGVAPETVSRWLSKGENAKSGPYAQFRQDVLSAIAGASVVAESQVKQSKPETWLRCGPRRLLGEQWREAESHSPVAVNVENATIVPPPSLADLAAALIELAKAGICLPLDAASEPDSHCLAPAASTPPCPSK